MELEQVSLNKKNNLFVQTVYQNNALSFIVNDELNKLNQVTVKNLGTIPGEIEFKDFINILDVFIFEKESEGKINKVQSDLESQRLMLDNKNIQETDNKGIYEVKNIYDPQNKVLFD